MTDGNSNFQKMLNARGQAEATVQRHIVGVLKDVLGAQISEADIIENSSLPGVLMRPDVVIGRTIIEIKKQAEDPADHESQLREYFEVLRRFPPLDFEKSESGIWRGFLTNGVKWLQYDLDVVKGDFRKIGEFFAQADEWAEFRAWLSGRVSAEKFLPPRDFSGFVQDFKDKIIQLSRTFAERESPGYLVKRALWSNLLNGAHILVGNDDELFARHTLLVCIARCVIARLEQSPSLFSRESKKILGEGFHSWMIECVDDSENGKLSALARDIYARIGVFDWHIAGRGDLMKNLYHGLIDRKLRHDFGEYYTPDWLARAVLEEVLDDEWMENAVQAARKSVSRREYPAPKFLDPACGSGTFLLQTALMLLEKAAKITDDKHDQANIVASLVAGIDVHPVAVELARATFATALPALPSEDKSEIRVYLGDSLQWMDGRGELFRRAENDSLVVVTDKGEELRFPRALYNRPDFNNALSDFSKCALTDNPNQIDREVDTLCQQRKIGKQDACEILTSVQLLHKMWREGRNHIWEWYIRNLLQPILLSEQKVERIATNPPWVVSNAMQPVRQSAFRNRAQERKLWAGGNLATQNDLAALFSATVTDLYLARESGRFGFVLPHTALRGGQWSPFRDGKWNPSADLSAAWDLSDVHEPPFPQSPSCVVLGKIAPKARPLVKAIPWRAHGVKEVQEWREVAPKIKRGHLYSLASAAVDAYYADKFRNGATLFPACLILAAPSSVESAGTGLIKFHTESSRKGGWKKISPQEGIVEEEFVLNACFSRNVAPFRLLDKMQIIAPWSPQERKILADSRAFPVGSHRLVRYWFQVERIYSKERSAGSPESLGGQIDYHGKLTTQLQVPPKAGRRKIVYPASGAIFFAARIPADLICSHTLFWHLARNVKEALYLLAIFNCDALAKAFINARRNKRDFMMRAVDEIPIPEFNADNKDHLRLAELAEKAEKIAAQFHISDTPLNRRNAAKGIKGLLASAGVAGQIDEIVKRLLPDFV